MNFKFNNGMNAALTLRLNEIIKLKWDMAARRVTKRIILMKSELR